MESSWHEHQVLAAPASLALATSVLAQTGGYSMTQPGANQVKPGILGTGPNR